MPYTWLPTDAPTRTRFFWITSDVFLKRSVMSNQDSYVLFLQGSLLVKAVPRKDHIMHLRSPVKSTLKCLILETLLWPGIMSTNLKNPKEQDDHKKGMLSNQPWLTHVPPTALLGIGGQQPLEDKTFLGTDFEMHAYWQGYAEGHPRPVNLVTHLPGDGDLDAGHHKVNAPTVKEFVVRKNRTIISGKAQGTYWNSI